MAGETVWWMVAWKLRSHKKIKFLAELSISLNRKEFKSKNEFVDSDPLVRECQRQEIRLAAGEKKEKGVKASKYKHKKAETFLAAVYGSCHTNAVTCERHETKTPCASVTWRVLGMEVFLHSPTTIALLLIGASVALADKLNLSLLLFFFFKWAGKRSSVLGPSSWVGYFCDGRVEKTFRTTFVTYFIHGAAGVDWI